MKAVKLLLPVLIENAHRNAGDVVGLPDERADKMIRLGHAELSDKPICNPETNPLADSISPLPPGGAKLDPLDALSPNVADNPGLKSLVQNAPKVAVKSEKVLPTEAKATPDKPVEVAKEVTANEVEVAKAQKAPEAPKPTPAPAPKPEIPKPIEAPKAE